MDEIGETLFLITEDQTRDNADHGEGAGHSTFCMAMPILLYCF